MFGERCQVDPCQGASAAAPALTPRGRGASRPVALRRCYPISPIMSYVICNDINDLAMQRYLCGTDGHASGMSRCALTHRYGPRSVIGAASHRPARGGVRHTAVLVVPDPISLAPDTIPPAHLVCPSRWHLTPFRMPISPASLLPPRCLPAASPLPPCRPQKRQRRQTLGSAAAHHSESQAMGRRHRRTRQP